jgi:hypothetical protein
MLVFTLALRKQLTHAVESLQCNVAFHAPLHRVTRDGELPMQHRLFFIRGLPGANLRGTQRTQVCDRNPDSPLPSWLRSLIVDWR